MEMYSPTPEKTLILHDMLEKAGRIVIVTHHHPDGDAAGSSTALMHFIGSSFGPKSRVILPTALPESLEFLLSEAVSTAECDKPAAEAAIASCDLLICLDFNTFSRTDFLEDALRSCKAPKVLIDHHLNPDTEAFDLVFSETGISSASELLFWILMRMVGTDDATVLPAGASLALMTGMTTDTNNFANSTYPSTLEMASALLRRGVDRDALVQHIFNEYRECRLRSLGKLLTEMKILPGGIAYMILDAASIEAFGIHEGDTEAFVNHVIAYM